VFEIHAKNVPPCVSVYAEFVFLGMLVFEIHAKNVPPCVSVYAEFVFLGMFVFEIHANNVSPSVFQFTRSLCSWECSCSKWESACMPWVSAPTSLLPSTGEFFYTGSWQIYTIHVFDKLFADI